MPSWANERLPAYTESIEEGLWFYLEHGFREVDKGNSGLGVMQRIERRNKHVFSCCNAKG